eukprot:748699-Hanusia_phi.AAC.5
MAERSLSSVVPLMQGTNTSFTPVCHTIPLQACSSCFISSACMHAAVPVASTLIINVGALPSRPCTPCQDFESKDSEQPGGGMPRGQGWGYGVSCYQPPVFIRLLDMPGPGGGDWKPESRAARE